MHENIIRHDDLIWKHAGHGKSQLICSFSTTKRVAKIMALSVEASSSSALETSADLPSQVAAIALNQVDRRIAKHAAFPLPYPAILGACIAGRAHALAREFFSSERKYYSLRSCFHSRRAAHTCEALLLI